MQPSASLAKRAPGATPSNRPCAPRLPNALPTMSEAWNGTPALIATIWRALSICTPKPTLSRTAVFALSVPKPATFVLLVGVDHRFVREDLPHQLAVERTRLLQLGLEGIRIHVDERERDAAAVPGGMIPSERDAVHVAQRIVAVRERVTRLLRW